MWEPDDPTLSILLPIFFGSPFPEPPSTLELLISFAMLFGPPFFGGAFAGIVTLIIIRKSSFFIEIFRLLIGAIGGYEGTLIFYIFLIKDSLKNPNEILKKIIDFHQIDLKLLFLGMLGAIDASIAIFMMRKVFRWRS
ncbi:hypothetical protein [Nostoc sp.]|uniref:hypothetical protein n=1 Tax=Nostoc sp. TaxID=1180 RepID=UPI0035944738